MKRLGGSISASYVVAALGEARCGDEADVAGTKDAQGSHVTDLVLLRPRFPSTNL